MNFVRSCAIAFFLMFVVLCSASQAAFGSAYMSVEPSSTGETVAVSEDGNAFVDVTTGYLYWSSGYLTYSSEASYDAQFGLIYVGPGNGVPELGGAWRHTYSLQIIYNPGVSLTLVTPYNTSIPFLLNGATWVSQPTYGVYLTCVVTAVGFTLTDNE